MPQPKKILGLIGSPRKLGNCEIAVKEISRRINEPHELVLLRLSDFRIDLCTGCYLCLFKGDCGLRDDLSLVIDAFADADAFIIAAPTYCLGANAALKLLADRILAFHSHSKEVWGKPAVGIGIAGLEGKEGYTKLNIDSFMRLFQMEVKASDILYAALPGEICQGDENRAPFDRFAAALFGEAVSAAGPRCGLCGGDTFRFLGDNRVRCMTCSNAGTVQTSDGQVELKIGISDHELILTQKDAMDHGAWLQQMKEKYRNNKTRLSEVTAPYKGIGTWIRPEKKKHADERVLES